MQAFEAEIAKTVADVCSTLSKLHEVNPAAAAEQGGTLLFLLRRLSEMNTGQLNLLVPLIYDIPLAHREGTLDLTKRLQTRGGNRVRFLGSVSHLAGHDYVFAVTDLHCSSAYGIQENILRRTPNGKKYEDRDDEEDIIVATAEVTQSTGN
jgi:hypothetical protein